MRKREVERRIGPVWRRQANQAFCDPQGNISILKTIAIFTQIVLLYRLGRDFDALIAQWEGLALVLTALLAPEMFGKLLAFKYGAATNGRKNATL